ncbi:MAG: DUF378 domain-containing protein [Nanoarchaeota archaeon]
MEGNVLDSIAKVLLIIGGLNWGLAIFSFDLAQFITIDWLMKIIYGLVAISAIYKIFTFNK